MKKFLLVMLALHVLMEGLVGLFLMVAPEQVAPNLAMPNLAFLINYGGAGVTMALAVAWFWPHRDNPTMLGFLLGVLATFHTAEALSGVMIAVKGGGAQVIASHGAFAVCFWILWFKRSALSQH